MAGTPRGDNWSADGREWRFSATPPPGQGTPLSAPAHVMVLLRGTRINAEFLVSEQVVARVGRQMLRNWLVSADPRVPRLHHPPLLLRRTGDVVYFQLERRTAPMILSAQAITLIRRVLRD